MPSQLTTAWPGWLTGLPRPPVRWWPFPAASTVPWWHSWPIIFSGMRGPWPSFPPRNKKSRVGCLFVHQADMDAKKRGDKTKILCNLERQYFKLIKLISLAAFQIIVLAPKKRLSTFHANPCTKQLLFFPMQALERNLIVQGCARELR